MPEAILVTRCGSCGWPMETRPDYNVAADRWVACNNPKCAEHDKKYAPPTVQLVRR